ncbi:hypothetical protein, partial [Actinoallomurus iriomotensis]|uniref:hypothetical protein n=1 Tax=Actinoallomurus iriomotensis TaxID=478107 RepID=UPI002556A6DA
MDRALGHGDGAAFAGGRIPLSLVGSADDQRLPRLGRDDLLGHQVVALFIGPADVPLARPAALISLLGPHSGRGDSIVDPPLQPVRRRVSRLDDRDSTKVFAHRDVHRLAVLTSGRHQVQTVRPSQQRVRHRI